MRGEFARFPEETETSIRQELERGRQALDAGKEGMARVCARRAAGAALAAIAPSMPDRSAPASAMSLLDRLAADDSSPETVRGAAHRLRSKLREDGAREASTNPLADAEIIVAFARFATGM
jgi:hypothetical protein